MKKNTKIAFYPCGLEIPESEIFKSPRNLGISLMGALSGVPSEDVEINRTAMSIGLGCFGLVSVNNAWYEDNDDFDIIDDEDDWTITSTVRFAITKEFLSQEVIADPINLYLNISPKMLLEGDIGGIQLFGPKRYLRYIKMPGEFFAQQKTMDALQIDNYLECGCEPDDAMLCPNEEEYNLFVQESDPARKFRRLLNLITSFASSLSLRMQYAGRVYLSLIVSPGAEAASMFRKVSRSKLSPPWKPTRVAAERYMKANGLEKKDVDPEVRRIVWGE